MLKIILLTTSLISSAFGASTSGLNLAELPTDPPSSGGGCPNCLAKQRLSEEAAARTEANRVIGRRYLERSTLGDVLGEWKAPLKTAIQNAALSVLKKELPETTELSSDLYVTINTAVEGIFGLLEAPEAKAQLEGRMEKHDHPLDKHYDFMTCWLGRLAQLETSKTMTSMLEELLNRHQGYAKPTESGDAGLC